MSLSPQNPRKPRARFPADRRLGDLTVEPLLVARRDPFRVVRLLPFAVELGGELGYVSAAGPQIILQGADLALEVGEQRRVVDHEALLLMLAGPTGRTT